MCEKCIEMAENANLRVGGYRVDSDVALYLAVILNHLSSKEYITPSDIRKHLPKDVIGHHSSSKISIKLKNTKRILEQRNHKRGNAYRRVYPTFYKVVVRIFDGYSVQGQF